MATDLFKYFIFSGGNVNILISKGWEAIPATVASVSFKAFYINILLASFNLIPIPPLDGSRLLHAVLPKVGKEFLDSMEKFGFIIILVLYYMDILQPIIAGIFKFFIDNIFLGLI